MNPQGDGNLEEDDFKKYKEAISKAQSVQSKF